MTASSTSCDLGDDERGATLTNDGRDLLDSHEMVVVVFNLTRFAREKYDHFALRAYLKSLGISLRNQLYAGIVDVPEYGVRGKRGDFEPLIAEDLFYRAPVGPFRPAASPTPKQRAHPDFPLRGLSAARPVDAA
jgi:hypothetical protein